MQEHVAEDKLKPFGFSYGKSGAHTARTMMFEELSSLLNHTSGEAGSTEDFRKAIVEDNCLGKPSGKSRELTFSHLRALYSLDPHTPIFRALLYFWQREEEGRPLLALLCAVARDPLLRKSFEWISAVPIGQQVTRESIEEKLVETYPDRFSPASRKSIAQNLNGTWTKSGHLSGRIHKIRQQARPTPAAAAFALYLGHLQGLRGEMLFHGDYSRILDHPPGEIMEQAELASRRGWILMKRLGSVIEVLFPALIRPEEKELLNEQ